MQTDRQTPLTAPRSRNVHSDRPNLHIVLRVLLLDKVSINTKPISMDFSINLLVACNAH
jgi:hypothetical protein